LSLLILPAEERDFPELWPIFHHVVSRENTHCYNPETAYEEARAIWMSPDVWTYKAMQGGEIVGTFLIRHNFSVWGRHATANGSYMVHPAARGQGVGRAMGVYSLAEAQARGFSAMQFNSVVSTNTASVRLWQSLGFQLIGTVPQAYRHSALGMVDIHIMHRFLADLPTE
jgi:L-amino acid N-acyltransferase YncA